MSILISAILSTSLMTGEEKVITDYTDRSEIKTKILELLKKRQQEKTLVLAPSKPKEEKVKTVKPEKTEPTVELEQTKVSPEYLLKPAAFSLYLEKYKTDDEVLTVEVNNHFDMGQFTTQMLNELPHTLHIKSKYFSTAQLKEMYEESISLKVEDLTPSLRGLANYSMNKANPKKQLVLIDNANDNYNAATIQKAVEHYVKDLVPLLEGETEIETVNNIYDFLFDNFDYAATNYKHMLVGNLGSGELACNGFSYLVDKLFEEANIESYIRAGHSHYWNVLTLEDGSEVTFDISTDLVLDEYKATLGASTKQHVEIASPIGFFTAEYTLGKYHDVQENNKFAH